MAGIYFPQPPRFYKPPAGTLANMQYPLMRGCQGFWPFLEGNGFQTNSPLATADATGLNAQATYTALSTGAPILNTNRTTSGGIGNPAGVTPIGSYGRSASSTGYWDAGNICDNLGTFSVSCWLSCALGSSQNNKSFVGKFGSGGFNTGTGWALGTIVPSTTTTVLMLLQNNNGNTFSAYHVTSGINLNSSTAPWFHVVATVSSNAVSAIYVNGVSQSLTNDSSGGSVTSTSNSNHLRFGDDGTAGAVVNARLDLIGIWNRVLTAGEIMQLYADPLCMMRTPAGTLFSRGVITKHSSPLSATPLGIPSSEVFGDERLGPAVTPLGIQSVEAIGAEIFSLALGLGGIPSVEAIGGGAPSLALEPGGILTAEVFGDEAFNLGFNPGDISSSEAIGAEIFSLALGPGGTSSGEAEGATALAENLLPRGISSAEAVGDINSEINAAVNIFPSGIPSLEQFGADVLVENTNISPSGITSAEALGAAGNTLSLLLDGITSAEFLGGIRATVGTAGAPFAIPYRRRNQHAKPPPGTPFNANSSVMRGLVFAALMNEQAGTQLVELLSSTAGNLSGTPPPTWTSYEFGPTLSFPGGTSSSRVSIVDKPQWRDIWASGPMSVSFWFKQTAAQLALSAGSAMLNKGDSTDGGQGDGAGFTHGWVVNSDKWHLDMPGYNNVTGIPVGWSTVYSGNQAIKLEFECSQINKAGGVYAPQDTNLHHVTITTDNGPNARYVDDYNVYLDGVRQGFGTEGVSGKYFQVSYGSDNTTSDSGYNLAIGAHTNGTNPYNGILDTVLLHNRVLTPAEATQLYVDPFCFLQRPKRFAGGQSSGASLSVTPLGIVSEQAFGALRTALSASLSVTPAGIGSAELFGALQTLTSLQIFPLGIVSAENLGSARAVISSVQALGLGGISSLESIGPNSIIVAVPTTTPGSRVIKPAAQYRIINVKLQARTL